MERDGNYIGYIYCVTNILNNKKYIGQTMRSIKRRWNAHKTESKTEDNPSYFHKAILKYGSDNFSISEVKKICCDSRDELKNELDFWEIKYIDELNTLRPNGYNITPGGCTSYITRQRKIVQISKHGEIIKIYDSIADALRELNLPEGALSSVLCGYTNTAHGFYWKYEDDNINEFIESITTPYIAMYDEYGKLEKIYDDYSDAAKDNNVQTSRIKSCCNGDRNHSKGKRFIEYRIKCDIQKEISPLSVTWGRTILQYDRDDKLIYSYRNIQELLSCNPSYKATTIRNCCSGNRQSAYNYIWKYA